MIHNHTQVSDTKSNIENLQLKEIAFVNNHTFTSTRPPFKLNYKNTSDAWQNIF